jgi:hypothetical protein
LAEGGDKLGWFIVVLGLQKLAVISAGPDSAGRPK